MTNVPRPPTSTYRVQFHAGFTFRDAARLVPYLHDLGISHVYASPYLRARSGSTHGYDVADPSSLNPELGSEEDYEVLVAELRRFGMGQLVDVVPNHMGIGDPGNFRWLDVLENGPASIYGRFFDINWFPLSVPGQPHPKLIVPTLGDQYGKVLENGELQVRYVDGAFVIDYYEHRFPVAPDTYVHLLEPVLVQLEDELGRRHNHSVELASILTALRHLPQRQISNAAEIEERNREKEIVKRRIRALYEVSAVFRASLDSTLREFNGRPGEPASFDRLDALIEEQSYRLCFWRVAAEEINYRRFFDITELAAVRMEDPNVFLDTHRLLLRLISEGKIQGLRIDHPDGLRDPASYFRVLQQHSLHALGVDTADDRFYVVIEKILLGAERLRPDWLVDGTTGYEFMNALNGLFVARHNEQFFNTIYFRFLRQGSQRFVDLVNSTRKMVMLISLASEVNELGYLLKDIATSDRRHRDFTLNSLTFVIREVIASLDVYRTYINPDTGAMSEADRTIIREAVREAKLRNPRTDPSIFDFVGETLLEPVGDVDRLRFIARFQQTTGPVMAKGAEDTAFYTYNRLISLNEVGGDPDQFGRSLSAFHRANLDRVRDWPASLLGTSTHDTKRSEDVRARINALSELPREWRSALTRWTRLNGRKKVLVEGHAAPDRNEEYLLYQTLLGAWPASGVDAEFVRRIDEFALKALKEAKVHTSWITPNTAYEQAVQDWLHAVLDTSEPNPFLDDFLELQRKVAFFGVFNSLSQTLLKLGSPGVADVYQGNELWDLSLVDPDNRRPVDFDLRKECLRRLDGDLLAQREDGRLKLLVTHRLLCLRRELPELFVGGSYTPLRTGGRVHRVPHVCAFARSADGKTLVVVAPTLVATLTRGAMVAPLGPEVWRDDWLNVPPAAEYRDVLSGQLLETITQDGGNTVLPLRDVFGQLPIAALLASD
ncbi:MAG TPA: malto-oligosyltrehalose synthase [Chloroflexota bacterium]|nr:malto-oligosyltrehalose synthase [Chloroflexota bacterium]